MGIGGKGAMRNLIVAAAAVTVLAAQAPPWFPDFVVAPMSADQAQKATTAGGLIGGCFAMDMDRIVGVSNDGKRLVGIEGDVARDYAKAQCPVIDPRTPEPQLAKTIQAASAPCQALYTQHLYVVSEVQQTNGLATDVVNDLQVCGAQLAAAQAKTCADLRKQYDSLSNSSGLAILADIGLPLTGADMSAARDKGRAIIKTKMTDMDCPNIP